MQTVKVVIYEMAASHVNTGIILVPDSCNLTDDMKVQQLLVANYNAQTDEKRQEIEKIFTSNDSILVTKFNKQRN